jgi:hypothetical protein
MPMDEKPMPSSTKILAACPLVLLLCSAASATPREEQSGDAGASSQLEQVAHAGEQAAAPRPEHPERFVRIAGFSWSKDAVEMQADITIESALPFALKEIEVACAQFARSGVEVETNRRTIAELLPARGRLEVDALDIGQINPEAGSSGCWIVSVTPA